MFFLILYGKVLICLLNSKNNNIIDNLEKEYFTDSPLLKILLAFINRYLEFHNNKIHTSTLIKPMELKNVIKN